MKKYEFNATNRIAKAVEEHSVKFHVIHLHGHEEVLTEFPVDNVPGLADEADAEEIA